MSKKKSTQPKVLSAVDWLKKNTVMTFFTTEGQILPRDVEAAKLVQTRFDAVPENLTEWLTQHSATVEYHPTRIEVSADVRVGRFVTTVSGMHSNDETAAIKELMSKARDSHYSIVRNQERLAGQTEIMLKDGLDSLLIEQ